MLQCDVDYRVIDLDDDQGLLFLTGNHRTFFVDNDLATRLRLGMDHLTDDEQAEWEQLSALGLVSDENRQRLRHSTWYDGADLAVNINMTNVCNLACTYCFADGGDYGRITNAMSMETVDHIFDFIEKNMTPSRSVRLEFFGGEPLAAFPVMREVCERSEKVAAEQGINFVYRISTNLTLMPKGVLELFAKHKFIVSVSIDGCREVQDANRPAKGGQGSYDRVMKAVRAVRDASDDITMVARMTVAQREPTLLDNMLELWKLNIFDYFQISPAVYPADEDEVQADPSVPSPKVVFVEIGRRPEDAKSSAPASSGCGSGSQATGKRHINFFLQKGMVEQFRDFLHAYPHLFTKDNRFKGVLEYERAVQFALEGQLALSFCAGGRTYFTHSPNHSISPCHRLVGDELFDVGTGEEGITRPPEDWRLPVDKHPVCGQCWARYMCGGGCKQENYVASGDVNVLNDESCRYQLLLAEEVLRMMATSSSDYLNLNRSKFDDLFVSCGRPVADSGRTEPEPAVFEQFTRFRPLAASA
jgi:uncharacterized protein